MMVTTIEKVGPELILHIDEKDTPIKYNVETHELFSFSGRKIKHFPTEIASKRKLEYGGAYYFRNSDGEGEEKLRYILLAIIDSVKNINHDCLNSLCLFWFYQDLWCSHLYDLPNRCPKGYIPWVKEKKKPISRESLQQFENEQKYNNLPSMQKEVMDFLKPDIDNCYGARQLYYRILHYNEEQSRKLCQIMRSTIKTFSWTPSADIEQFLTAIEDCPDWVTVVDPNRSFIINRDLVVVYKNKSQSEAIHKFEMLGKAITELTYNGLSVVIPLSLQDLMDEGKQQHNCVGRLYPNDVANGRSYIYFIRKSDNISKSYVTCEYNPFLRNQRTTQALAFANRQCEDPDVDKLTSMVDDILKEVIPTKK